MLRVYSIDRMHWEIATGESVSPGVEHVAVVKCKGVGSVASLVADIRKFQRETPRSCDEHNLSFHYAIDTVCDLIEERNK